MTSASDGFETIRGALERAGVRYAVGGSWASAAFGEPHFTNGVDVLAEFTAHNLHRFLSFLPAAFYVDKDEALRALAHGRPFNALHSPTALKFDFFPSSAFPLGPDELDRAITLQVTQLSHKPIPFVTPEDILLAKLHWFRLGGEVSERQWRDIQGVLRGSAATLDQGYLDRGAAKLNVVDLLDRARSAT